MEHGVLALWRDLKYGTSVFGASELGGTIEVPVGPEDQGSRSMAVFNGTRGCEDGGQLAQGYLVHGPRPERLTDRTVEVSVCALRRHGERVKAVAGVHEAVQHREFPVGSDVEDCSEVVSTARRGGAIQATVGA